MSIKSMIVYGLLGFLAAFSAAAAPAVEAPRLNISGKAGSVLAAPVPEYGNFCLLGTDKAVTVQTFYKIFHDDKNLYVAIRAMEPDPGSMVRKENVHDSEKIWRSDCVELNFINRGNDKYLYKIMIDSLGTVADAAGEDDNTGLNKFALDYSFESSVKVISAQVNKDCWTLEIAIPMGAFNSGSDGKFKFFDMQIGRTRRTLLDSQGRKTLEMSASTPTGKVTFSEVSAFAPVVLKDFNAADYVWQLNDSTVKTVKKDNSVVCQLAGSLVNCGKRFAMGKLRAVLVDRSGKVVDRAEKVFGTQPRKLQNFEIPLKVKKNGEHKLQLEVRNAKNELLCGVFRTLMVDYQAAAIKLTTPWYRNNIYASMPPVEKIEGSVILEENIGAPLEITLSGAQGVVQSRKIAAADRVNPFSFDFKNMPDGEYFVTASGVKVRIRKLPFSPGEVWLDRQGILHREGKKIMPLGVFGMNFGRGEGLNVNLTFVSPFRSREALIAWLDQCEQNGRYAWIYPYHRFPKPYTYSWAPFASQDMQKSSLSEEQKKILKEYVELTGKHRGLLGHFLTDEPEGRSENPEFFRAVKAYLEDIDPYHPTLINHYGVEGATRFKGIADVVGLDCYWDFFKDDKFHMQPDISYKNARIISNFNKPLVFIPQAFDWGHINRFGGRSRAPKFDEMRIQIFMAFLGDAKGMVPYSYSTVGGSYSHQLRIGLLHIMKEPAALGNILMEKSDMQAVIAPQPLIAGVKKLGNEYVIIAVNPTLQPIQAQIKVKFPTAGELAVSGEKRTVKVVDGVLSDHFDALGTHVYVSGGLNSNGIDLAAVRNEIKKADEARFKPGNLAAAGELSLAEIREYKKGIIPENVTKITASSSKPISDRAQAYEYFLQDGIVENIPKTVWPTWAPADNDVQPWIEFALPQKSKVSKVNVHTIINKTGDDSPVLDAHVEVEVNGQFQKVGAVSGNTAASFEIAFPAVETTKVRLVLDKLKRPFSRLLSEVEVMQ